MFVPRRDLKVLIHEAQIFELLQDQPLALLGEAANFLPSHLLEEVPYRLSNSKCEDFGLLLHAATIDVCVHMSTTIIAILIDKCMSRCIIVFNVYRSSCLKNVGS